MEHQRISAMEPSMLSGSSKRRAKAPGNIFQVASCLVDRCSSDPSQCREYHRRHKVCESHSKTPKVTVGGREQRFCQQCSRFHSLIEFDESKRSCRKRLDEHNRRRIKSQLGSLSRNPGPLISSKKGAKTVSYGYPESFTTSIVSSFWNEAPVNAGKKFLSFSNRINSNHIVRRNSYYEASSQGYIVNQLMYLLSSENEVPNNSIQQSLPNPNSA